MKACFAKPRVKARSNYLDAATLIDRHIRLGVRFRAPHGRTAARLNMTTQCFFGDPSSVFTWTCDKSNHLCKAAGMPTAKCPLA